MRVFPAGRQGRLEDEVDTTASRHGLRFGHHFVLGSRTKASSWRVGETRTVTALSECTSGLIAPYIAGRQKWQPGSVSHGAELPILRARATVAGRDEVETSMLKVQLRSRVRDMRRRPQMLPNAAGRTAMTLDVTLFCTVFHLKKRGSELFDSGGVRGVAYDPRRGAIRQCDISPERLYLGTKRTSATFARSRPWSGTDRPRHTLSTRRGVRVSVHWCTRSWGKRKPGAHVSADDHHLPAHLRPAGMEDYWTPFQLRRSHIMDSTAVDVLLCAWGGNPQLSHTDT